MEMQRIALKIEGLTRDTARECETVLATIPGVAGVDTWIGRAELRVEDGHDPEAVVAAALARLKGTKWPDARQELTCTSCEVILPGTTGNLWRAGGLLALIVLLNQLFSRAGFADSGLTQATTFFAAVVLGLVAGSSSCIAVSGGLLLSATAMLRERNRHLGWWGRMQPVAIFILGRVVGYGFFGAVIGMIGVTLTPSAAVTGVLTLLAATVMIVVGIDMLGLAPLWLRRLIPRMPKAITEQIAGSATKTQSMLMPFVVGVATFFLPCGFTQSLQIYALTTGSVAHSAALLAGFAIGTIPALLALGAASSSLKGKWGRMFFQVSGAVVFFLGITSVQNGLTLLGYPLPSLRLGAHAQQVEQQFPPIVEGKQVIRMVVGGEGTVYSPSMFTVREGVPVRWEVDGKSLSGCVSVLQSQQLGIRQPLRLGANVIEFTPQRAGIFSFSCSMGTYRGTMQVLPSKS